MNSTLLAVAVIVSVILTAVIAVQRVKFKNLVQQTEQSMKDLREKESIMHYSYSYNDDAMLHICVCSELY